MAICLGIYIDENIIKYAKISNTKGNIKVEAFGIKIYTDLKETIDQIISETSSSKIPISININGEVYNYLYMSNLLNRKDLNKAIATEFDSNCYEKGINPNALENRYILVNDVNEKEKIKVIHISADKMKINQTGLDFKDHIVTAISPIALSIANIVPLAAKENSLIVNIEDKTIITTVLGEKIYEINKLDIGAGKILDEINNKEGSYQKAYGICKNTTIYTMEGKSGKDEENDHLDDIIPTLYKISNEIKNIIDNSLVKINNVYITGTGAVINNIDLYFEELLDKTKCQILKPFFVEDNPKINVKDYIEVNSAIALALQGLGYGLKDANFSKQRSSNVGGINITTGGGKSIKEIFDNLNSIDISNPKVSKWVSRYFTIALVFFLSYAIISIFIANQIDKKQKEADLVIANSNKQIEAINKDITSVNIKASDYDTLTKNLEDATNKIAENNSYRNVIPTLLSQVMAVIPKEVKLTSIENTSDKKIIINAQSNKYEQLSYFKAILKSKGILEPTSVVSSEAVKDGEAVKIVIEGDLP